MAYVKHTSSGFEREGRESRHTEHAETHRAERREVDREVEDPRDR
ncbi:hypothetical protein [Nakamurella sp. PAMC28650]|nr:hypothetical protein [Nakamurella sp. PAMC28650]